MASFQEPGLSNPVYDISQSVEVQEENDSEESEEVEERSLEMKRTESDGSMLEFLIVNCDRKSIHEESEAILIDDGRIPCSDDAIIDLNIDSKPLFFVSIFLLVSLQRIPRHYSDKVKIALTVGQVIVACGMLVAIAYDMGAIPGGTKTLTISQWDNFATAVKNVISNARFPLLYIVGIFYFRTRHLEGMLSEVRLTRRYWKYGRKILIIMVAMVYLFTVIIPTFFNIAQMLFSNEGSPEKSYKWIAIVVSGVISLSVRSVSLSPVFAFILTVFLIYCQVRLFKEQIQKWPRECMNRARDCYTDISRMVRKAERYFQPFLIIHIVMLLVMIIPITISCVEQFEAQGSYTSMVTKGKSMAYEEPIIIPTTTSLTDLTNRSTRSLIRQQINTDPTKKSPMDKFNESATEYKENHIDAKGIAKVALIILADVIETACLYGLPVLWIFKLDKCIREVRDTVRMLKFGQQQEKHYMFQNAEDVSAWDSILSDARGIQLMGFNLASFKAALIMLLFPFVSTVFRYMLRHVNITP